MALCDARPPDLRAHALARDGELLLTDALHDVDLRDGHEQAAVRRVLAPRVHLPDEVQQKDQRERDVALEEDFGVGGAAEGLGWVLVHCEWGWGCGWGGTYEETRVERRHETDDVERNAGVATDDAEGSLVRKLIEGVPVELPRLAEPDVRKADATVKKEVGDTGESEKPGEDLVARLGRLVDEGQEPEKQLEDDGRHGSALAVDLGQELGRHAGGGHGLDGAGGRVGGGVRDRDDGDGDDGVENRRETLDTGHLDGEHEG